MNDLNTNLIELLNNLGLQGDKALIIRAAVVFIGIILAAFLMNLITKKIIIRYIKVIGAKTKTEYDDIFIEKKVFDRLSHLVPALIIYYTIEYAILKHPDIVSGIKSVCSIYMIIIVLMVIDSFLNALHLIYRRFFKMAKKIPIKGYIQVLKIIFIFIGIILILSVLLGKSPGGIFAGIGALAAVLMLVFKDTILGFVAGIQLTAYNMVKPGDWISMPSRNADGTVLDISLTTVKIQNWNKTITTVPTSALVSESFSNWNGMEESGGRRIKRHIYFDLNSMKFCSDELLNKFKKISLLKDYIEKKETELKYHNEEKQINDLPQINGRNLTNIGTFRKYVEFYLKAHPKIHKNMTFLVRQLQPTEKGLPIEIYVFCTEQAWAKIEEIQGDIFDHLFAIIPEFELKLFQNPTGQDLKNFIAK